MSGFRKSAAALIVIGGMSASAQHVPLCVKGVKESLDQSGITPVGGLCATYTECMADSQCTNDGDLQSCGVPVIDIRYCRNLAGGTWDPETERCVGGHASGAWYISGVRQMYPNTVPCQGGGPR